MQIFLRSLVQRTLLEPYSLLKDKCADKHNLFLIAVCSCSSPLQSLSSQWLLEKVLDNDPTKPAITSIWLSPMTRSELYFLRDTRFPDNIRSTHVSVFKYNE